MKSEFYFNAVVDKLIKQGVVTTKVVNTPAKWFGVTYQEDKPQVKQSLTDLINMGVYPASLWS